MLFRSGIQKLPQPVTGFVITTQFQQFFQSANITGNLSVALALTPCSSLLSVLSNLNISHRLLSTANTAPFGLQTDLAKLRAFLMVFNILFSLFKFERQKQRPSLSCLIPTTAERGGDPEPQADGHVGGRDPSI